MHRNNKSLFRLHVIFFKCLLIMTDCCFLYLTKRENNISCNQSIEKITQSRCHVRKHIWKIDLLKIIQKKYDQNGCCIFNNSFYALPIVQIIMLAITEYLMKNIFQIGKWIIISYPKSKNYLDFYLQLEPRLNLYVEICCP